MSSAPLERPVLVLNRLWQPVHICSVKRAFSLLALGHAQVVDCDAEKNYYTHNFDGWLERSLEAELEQNPQKKHLQVHTIALSFLVPEIIVLSFYDRLPKKEVKLNRDTIFERDDHTCQYCGQRFPLKDLNLDHVIPRHKNGQTTWENVVCSCIKCNTKKGNQLPKEANMHPLKEPKAPKWRPYFSLSRRPEQYPEIWEHFINFKKQEVQTS